MDIFKLIYQHDIRLDELKERPANRKDRQPELSLEDFMKPDPTYSKFYLTGTLLSSQEEPVFGLNRMKKTEAVYTKLDEALADYSLFYQNEPVETLSAIVDEVPLGQPMVAIVGSTPPPPDLEELYIDEQSNIGQRKTALRALLTEGWVVIYKEKAHHGYDLHFFSQDNIYTQFFYPLQQLTGQQDFRFFSVNGRRITSERKFYFETWTLARPPHGAEEVFPETVLS